MKLTLKTGVGVIRYLTKILLFHFLITVVGCEKENSNPTKPVNHIPEIVSISASPSAIGKNQKSRLSVVAIDEDGDALQYNWSTTGGVFLDGTESKLATWKAPDVLGSYECKVVISDGVDTTAAMVNIDVVEVAILKIADEPLDFSYDLTSGKFLIENSGKVDLHWKVIPKAHWIKVEPGEGSTNTEIDEVEVAIDRKGFAAGEYNGLIGVESNGGNIDILVTFTTLITPEMVLIPAGEFTMGSNSGYQNELPIHKVSLDAYWIDKYEVTNQEYVDFLNALYENGEINIDVSGDGYAAYKDGKQLIKFFSRVLTNRGIDCVINFDENNFIAERGTENYPVCFVTWYGALAFAEHFNKRLPTEAEWEYAARGVGDRKYPCGNLEPTQFDCNYTMNIGHPLMVGLYSPLGDSPFGCADMAGNAWEWCSSLLKDYPYDSQDGRENLSAEGCRIVRGGGWDSLTQSLRCAARTCFYPADQYPSYGFRCAKSTD
ncbi:formylglycine-generating enzyme family protein [candidate division KSB1 bacterium]|nr:formylglycine-generating enzyme family protein [candidate division KSB1 bacterium]